MRMKRFGTGSIAVDQGSELLFSDFQHDGAMWVGEGPRQVARRISFAQPFHSAPAVQVGIAMWDMDNQANARADIAAEGVDREGFSIVFRTWGDTRVARVRADWMAIGEVPGEDRWDLG